MNKNILKPVFKLNDYECVCLEVIMNEKKCNAKRLGEVVPRPRTYDVCETLYKKGLIKIVKSNAGVKDNKFIARSFNSIKISEMIKNTKALILKKAKQDIIDLNENLKLLKFVEGESNG